MPTANEALHDAAVRHQIKLLRFSEGEARSVATLLEESDAELVKLLQGGLTEASEKRLRGVLSSVRKLRTAMGERVAGRIQEGLSGLADTEAQWELDAIAGACPVVLDLHSPSVATLKAIASRPIQGVPLKGWMNGIVEQDVRRVEQQLRLGIVAGETVDQMARRLRGTKAGGYEDGVLGTTRRNAQALARTGVAHVSDGARQGVWEANADIIKGVRWVATLDGRTTPICQSRDGHVYTIQDRPAVPAHWQCRSTTVAVLDGEQIVGERPMVRDPRTRAQREKDFRAEAREAAGEERWRQLSPAERNALIKARRDRWAAENVGTVPSTTTYEEWLRRQPAAFQDEVLGKARGRMFREEGLTLDKFVDKSGRRYTLAELRAENAGDALNVVQPGVGMKAKALLQQGLSNQEVLEAIKAEFPDASTSLASIASYKSELKKAGLLDLAKGPKLGAFDKSPAKALSDVVGQLDDSLPPGLKQAIGKQWATVVEDLEGAPGAYAHYQAGKGVLLSSKKLGGISASQARQVAAHELGHLLHKQHDVLLPDDVLASLKATASGLPPDARKLYAYYLSHTDELVAEVYAQALSSSPITSQGLSAADFHKFFDGEIAAARKALTDAFPVPVSGAPTPLPGAPSLPYEVAGQHKTVGSLAKALLQQGMPDDDVLKAVKAQFPNASTGKASLASYKSELKKKGLLPNKSAGPVVVPTKVVPELAPPLPAPEVAAAGHALPTTPSPKALSGPGLKAKGIELMKGGTLNTKQVIEVLSKAYPENAADLNTGKVATWKSLWKKANPAEFKVAEALGGKAVTVAEQAGPKSLPVLYGKELSKTQLSAKAVAKQLLQQGASPAEATKVLASSYADITAVSHADLVELAQYEVGTAKAMAKPYLDSTFTPAVKQAVEVLEDAEDALPAIHGELNLEGGLTLAEKADLLEAEAASTPKLVLKSLDESLTETEEQLLFVTKGLIEDGMGKAEALAELLDEYGVSGTDALEYFEAADYQLGFKATQGAKPSPQKLSPVVPDVATLKQLPTPKLKGQNAGTKKIFVDDVGQKWIFRPADDKPFATDVQEMYSVVASKVKPGGSLPVGRVEIDGKVGTLQKFIDPVPPDLTGVKPSHLTMRERLDVASEHLLDWMMSQHDSHKDQWLRVDGRVIGIDKEQGFRFFGKDKLSVDYDPNATTPFYNTFWKSWAKGDFDFDPTTMAESLARIEAIPDADYVRYLESYAQKRWYKEPKKAEEFVAAALKRKHDVRTDFEGFLTDLHRKRYGVEGKFTFDKGWEAGGATGGLPEVSPAMQAKIKSKVSIFGKPGLASLKNDPFGLESIAVDLGVDASEVEKVIDSLLGPEHVAKINAAKAAKAAKAAGEAVDYVHPTASVPPKKPDFFLKTPEHKQGYLKALKALDGATPPGDAELLAQIEALGVPSSESGKVLEYTKYQKYVLDRQQAKASKVTAAVEAEKAAQVAATGKVPLKDVPFGMARFESQLGLSESAAEAVHEAKLWLKGGMDVQEVLGKVEKHYGKGVLSDVSDYITDGVPVDLTKVHHGAAEYVHVPSMPPTHVSLDDAKVDVKKLGPKLGISDEAVDALAEAKTWLADGADLDEVLTLLDGSYDQKVFEEVKGLVSGGIPSHLLEAPTSSAVVPAAGPAPVSIVTKQVTDFKYAYQIANALKKAGTPISFEESEFLGEYIKASKAGKNPAQALAHAKKHKYYNWKPTVAEVKKLEGIIKAGVKMPDPDVLKANLLEYIQANHADNQWSLDALLQNFTAKDEIAKKFGLEVEDVTTAAELAKTAQKAKPVLNLAQAKAQKQEVLKANLVKDYGTVEKLKALKGSQSLKGMAFEAGLDAGEADKVLESLVKPSPVSGLPGIQEQKLTELTKGYLSDMMEGKMASFEDEDDIVHELTYTHKLSKIQAEKVVKLAKSKMGLSDGTSVPEIPLSPAQKALHKELSASFTKSQLADLQDVELKTKKELAKKHGLTMPEVEQAISDVKIAKQVNVDGPIEYDPSSVYGQAIEAIQELLKLGASPAKIEEAIIDHPFLYSVGADHKVSDLIAIAKSSPVAKSASAPAASVARSLGTVDMTPRRPASRPLDGWPPPPRFTDEQKRAAVKQWAGYVDTAGHGSMLADQRKAGLHDGPLGTVTAEEAAAIRSYTGNLYGKLNRALRAGKYAEDLSLQAYVEAAQHGLSKLPKYEGQVARGLTLAPDKLDSFLSVYRKDAIVEDSAFVSTSSGDTAAFSGNVFMKIRSKTGVAVSKYSIHPGEREVLFAPGTKFRVTRVEKVNTRFIVHMEEL